MPKKLVSTVYSEGNFVGVSVWTSDRKSDAVFISAERLPDLIEELVCLCLDVAPKSFAPDVEGKKRD